MVTKQNILEGKVFKFNNKHDSSIYRLEEYYGDKWLRQSYTFSKTKDFINIEGVVEKVTDKAITISNIVLGQKHKTRVLLNEFKLYEGEK